MVVPIGLGFSALFFTISLVENPIISVISGLIGVMALVMSLILFPLLLYAQERQLGDKWVGKQQKALAFIPVARNWIEGVGDVGVLFVGTLFAMMFLLGSNPQVLFSDYPVYPTDEELEIAGLIALTTSAYCYHFRVLFHRHRERVRKRSNLNRNRRTLPRRKGKVPTMTVEMPPEFDDPIETELNEMRRKIDND